MLFGRQLKYLTNPYSGMRGSLNQWLSGYELRRTDPYWGGEGGGRKLSSTRFDIEGMSWDEIREIEIPQLGPDMNFGKSFEALRKSRYALRRNRAEGSYDNKDLEYRINRIQYFLGIDITEWDDLNPTWVKEELAREEREFNNTGEIGEEEELSIEERQLKAEEEAEELADWGLDEDDEW